MPNLAQEYSGSILFGKCIEPEKHLDYHAGRNTTMGDFLALIVGALGWDDMILSIFPTM